LDRYPLQVSLSKQQLCQWSGTKAGPQKRMCTLYLSF